MILILGASFLPSSVQTTLLEKKIILTQKGARLALMSDQALAQYNRQRERKRRPRSSSSEVTPGVTKRKKEFSRADHQEPRNKRTSLSSSKFNLWPLLYDEQSSVSKILYDKAIHLIDRLYKREKFYQEAQGKEIAKKILNTMIGKKATSLAELFPEDPALGKIFYKMIKGTNTGYPSLEEYFKIENCSKTPPIKFSYASTPVLQAVLGEMLTEKILKAEKEKREINSRGKYLTEKQLKDLLLQYPPTDFDINDLNKIFSFGKKEKGLPELYVDEELHITSTKKSLTLIPK